MYKAITHIGDTEVALYTAHLDYRNCAYYDARGYDGNTWDEEPPVTNLDTLLWLNEQSVRDDAIACLPKRGEKGSGSRTDRYASEGTLTSLPIWTGPRRPKI